ncbi:hypothetical protein DRO51_01290 [Candidatus Bathyarchaeota archaeon]|nr:MAG: hypothetical protein DRO51_01290 [Candidatus Bathyarchaeota archaeon]
MTYYVDANYWIYWFDKRFPEHKHVLKIMRKAIREGIVLNTITVVEIAHYFRHMPKREFKERMERILGLSTLTLAELDLEILKTALDILAEYANMGIGGRDSIILATMKNKSIKKILTHDKTFKKIRGIEVVDTIPS